MAIQRYEIETKPYMSGASMTRDPDGEWCSHEEVRTELEQLRAALVGLLQSLESEVHGLIDIRAAEARSLLERMT